MWNFKVHEGLFAALVWSRLYGCCKIFNVTATASLTTDEFAAEPRHQQQCVCRGPAGAESQNTRRTRAKIFYLVAKNIHDRRRECGVTKHERPRRCRVCCAGDPVLWNEKRFCNSSFLVRAEDKVRSCVGWRRQSTSRYLATAPPRRNQEWNF